MINLLPPSKIEETNKTKAIKTFFKLGYLLLLFLIFLLILFFSIEIYLTSENQGQKFLIENANILSSDPKYNDLENKIKDSNKIITQINNFYEAQPNISDVLEKITNILPSNVYLVSISYRQDSPQVILRGKAKTRDDFLAFKKSLEDQKEIKNLDSPISNLLKTSDIDFSFTFDLNNR